MEKRSPKLDHSCAHNLSFFFCHDLWKQHVTRDRDGKVGTPLYGTYDTYYYGTIAYVATAQKSLKLFEVPLHVASTLTK